MKKILLTTGLIATIFASCKKINYDEPTLRIVGKWSPVCSEIIISKNGGTPERQTTGIWCGNKLAVFKSDGSLIQKGGVISSNGRFSDSMLYKVDGNNLYTWWPDGSDLDTALITTLTRDSLVLFQHKVTTSNNDIYDRQVWKTYTSYAKF